MNEQAQEKKLHTTFIEVGDLVTFIKDSSNGKHQDMEYAIVEEICEGCNGVVLQGEPDHYPISEVAIFKKKYVRRHLDQKYIFKFLRGIGDVVFLNQSKEGTIPAHTIRDAVVMFLKEQELQQQYFQWLRSQ